MELKDYARHREKSTPVRIFMSDKVRFDDLQRRLAVMAEGVHLSQSQVMTFLLDLAEKWLDGKIDL